MLMPDDPLKSVMFRPFSIWAAGLLEVTLLLHDSKGTCPWETTDPYQIVAKIDEEYGEVKDACAECCCEENRTAENMQHLQDELSDLAATCYMLAARLDPEMSQLRRGRLPQDHYCRNCGSYDCKKSCGHDNIERIMRQEKYEPCPFWSPMPVRDDEFRAEVMRKVEENR
jgi:NTP pyrophosphatase (non-canonical NTP hydrolase)